MREKEKKTFQQKFLEQRKTQSRCLKMYIISEKTKVISKVIRVSFSWYSEHNAGKIFLVVTFHIKKCSSHTWLGVNLTNILRAAFLYKSVLSSFSQLTVWGSHFFVERILAKKQLVKCWWNWLYVTTNVRTIAKIISSPQSLPFTSTPSPCSHTPNLSLSLIHLYVPHTLSLSYTHCLTL